MSIIENTSNLQVILDAVSNLPNAVSKLSELENDVGFVTDEHTHDASGVTSGTFATARIPNLAASKITSGTLPVARGGTGVTSLSELAAIMGSAQITKGNYTGNGNKVSLTFPFTPKFVVIYETSSGSPSFGFFISGSAKVGCCYSGGGDRTYLGDASVSGNTFTSDADYITYNRELYYYVAFG